MLDEERERQLVERWFDIDNVSIVIDNNKIESDLMSSLTHLKPTTVREFSLESDDFERHTIRKTRQVEPDVFTQPSASSSSARKPPRGPGFQNSSSFDSNTDHKNDENPGKKNNVSYDKKQGSFTSQGHHNSGSGTLSSEPTPSDVVENYASKKEDFSIPAIKFHQASTSDSTKFVAGNFSPRNSAVIQGILDEAKDDAINQLRKSVTLEVGITEIFDDFEPGSLIDQTSPSTGSKDNSNRWAELKKHVLMDKVLKKRAAKCFLSPNALNEVKEKQKRKDELKAIRQLRYQKQREKRARREAEAFAMSPVGQAITGLGQWMAGESSDDWDSTDDDYEQCDGLHQIFDDEKKRYPDCFTIAEDRVLLRQNTDDYETEYYPNNSRVHSRLQSPDQKVITPEGTIKKRGQQDYKKKLQKKVERAREQSSNMNTHTVPQEKISEGKSDALPTPEASNMSSIKSGSRGAGKKKKKKVLTPEEIQRDNVRKQAVVEQRVQEMKDSIKVTQSFVG